jgi:hypothetical protein
VTRWASTPGSRPRQVPRAVRNDSSRHGTPQDEAGDLTALRREVRSSGREPNTTSEPWRGSVPYGVMTWFRILQEASARRELTLLSDRIIPGLRSVEPALQAAIDQHAAAIRDILSLTAGRAGLVEVAAYARGVRDAAVERGWPARCVSVETDWVTVRLLAAVSLALSTDRQRYEAADLPAL